MVSVLQKEAATQGRGGRIGRVWGSVWRNNGSRKKEAAAASVRAELSGVSNEA